MTKDDAASPERIARPDLRLSSPLQPVCMRTLGNRPGVPCVGSFDRHIHTGGWCEFCHRRMDVSELRRKERFLQR